MVEKVICGTYLFLNPLEFKTKCMNNLWYNKVYYGLVDLYVSCCFFNNNVLVTQQLNKIYILQLDAEVIQIVLVRTLV